LAGKAPCAGCQSLLWGLLAGQGSVGKDLGSDKVLAVQKGLPA
jgi:hypothetical protein